MSKTEEGIPTPAGVAARIDFMESEAYKALIVRCIEHLNAIVCKGLGDDGVARLMTKIDVATESDVAISMLITALRDKGWCTRLKKSNPSTLDRRRWLEVWEEA